MAKQKISGDELTAKDRLFIDTYFEMNFNGTRAYMKAFNVPEAKSQSAKSQAVNLMAKPHMKKEFEKRFEELRAANLVNIETNISLLKDQLMIAVEKNDSLMVTKIIDLLNKMTGAYTTKIDANVTGSIKLVIPGLDIPTEPNED